MLFWLLLISKSLSCDTVLNLGLKFKSWFQGGTLEAEAGFFFTKVKVISIMMQPGFQSISSLNMFFSNDVIQRDCTDSTTKEK